MRWPTVPLGQLADFRNGINYSRKNFGKGIKVIGVSDFQDYSKPYYESLEEVNPQGVVTDEDILEDSDIIFVRSNGNKDLIGRSLFIDSPVEKVTFSGFCIRARFLDKTECPRFYSFLFKSDIVRKTLSARGGGTNIANLNQKILKGLEVPYPPRLIRSRIASILSNYDDLIDNNNRRIALLEEAVHRLYREWFIHLRFPGHERVAVVDGVPEGWEQVSVSDLYLTSSGGTPSRKKQDEYFSGGDISWIKTQELQDRWLLSTDEKITSSGLQNSSAKLFPIETFIIAMYGATIGQFSILAIDSATNQACCALLKQPDSPFGYEYAFGYFLSERSKIISMGQGSAQPNISQKVIKSLSMLKPKDNVINQYNEIAGVWLQGMLCYQTQNVQLREARDRLLPRLMNGSIPV